MVIDIYLTVMCILKGYTFCVPLKTKTAAKMVQAYVVRYILNLGDLQKFYLKIGLNSKSIIYGCSHSNGSSAKLLLPPYHPQSNERIEGFHNFLKACTSKHVSKSLE